MKEIRTYLGKKMNGAVFQKKGDHGSICKEFG